jgi:beta-glucosidase
VLRGLGFQQAEKGSPPSVVDALGQPRSGQSRHGEVLNGDRLVLADQPQGQLVMVIGPLVADPGEGVADVLFGHRPFTGRLSMTWPRTLDQEPINVGDRPYDPLFPYGWGLRTKG